MSLENIRKLFNENNWQFIAIQMSNTEKDIQEGKPHITIFLDLFL